MVNYVRHLVQCRCIVSAVKQSGHNHCFYVFSTFNNEGEFVEKFVQCNNCGIIHRVIEVNKSKIVSNKENMNSIVTIEDLSNTLHEKLVALLKANNVEDVSLWENAKFIVERQLWGSFVCLSRDSTGEQSSVKLLKFISPTIFIVESEIREELI